MKKQFENLGSYAIGHKFGLNPDGTIAMMVEANMHENLTALIDGFDQGRRDLLEYNGEDAVTNPPQHIISLNSMFLYVCDGMLNIKLDEDEYNEVQRKHVRDWYESGQKQYNQDWDIQVGLLLEQNNILLKL